MPSVASLNAMINNVNRRRRRSAVPNILADLAWQAGASTTLAFNNGKARAVATDVVNPRIFKGPFHTTAGVKYRYHGTIYPGTAVLNIFARVSLDNTIQPDGPVQEIGDTSGPHLLDGTWTAGSNVDLYFGFVALVDTIGQYGEIDDAFSISVED